MTMSKPFFLLLLAASAAGQTPPPAQTPPAGQTPAAAQTAAPIHNPPPRTEHDNGFEDTPMLPGLPYHVHDSKRPHPPMVTPGEQPGGAPSDAIVLFDGRDLTKWQAHASTITKAGGAGAAEWKVQDGYMEVVPKTGRYRHQGEVRQLPVTSGMGFAHGHYREQPRARQ